MAPLVEPPGPVLLIVGREEFAPPSTFGGQSCVATRDCLAVGVVSADDAPTSVEFSGAVARSDLQRLGRFTIESEGSLSLRDVYNREYDSAGVTSRPCGRDCLGQRRGGTLRGGRGDPGAVTRSGWRSGRRSTARPDDRARRGGGDPHRCDLARDRRARVAADPDRAVLDGDVHPPATSQDGALRGDVRQRQAVTREPLGDAGVEAAGDRVLADAQLGARTRAPRRRRRRRALAVRYPTSPISRSPKAA